MLKCGIIYKEAVTFMYFQSNAKITYDEAAVQDC